MTLEFPTLKDVETWKGIYELASNGKPENSPEKKIFNIISVFQGFCNDYAAEMYALAANASDDQLEIDMEGVRSAYWKPIVSSAQQHQDAKYSSLLKLGYAQLEVFQHDLMKRVKNLKLDDHIVLYFEEEGGKAVRFPFGSIRLIGVPLRDLSKLKKDWMAIPHELGHHLYWNAQFSTEDKAPLPAPGTNFLAKEIGAAVDGYATEITNRTPGQRDQIKEHVRKMLDDWTEEIFADVVGTRIALNEFVSAAWGRVLRMVLTVDKKGLFTSDGEHPMPYLLPYIRAYAADLNPEAYVDWGKYKYPWEKKGGIDEFKALISDDQENPITISTLRKKAIKILVDKIVERLRSLEIEELIKGSSPMAELKRFITSVNPDTKTDADMLMMLRTPIILEKNEYWICSRGDRVRGASKKCPLCGARRWPWSPRVD